MCLNIHAQKLRTNLCLYFACILSTVQHLFMYLRIRIFHIMVASNQTYRIECTIVKCHHTDYWQQQGLTFLKVVYLNTYFATFIPKHFSTHHQGRRSEMMFTNLQGLVVYSRFPLKIQKFWREILEKRCYVTDSRLATMCERD